MIELFRALAVLVEPPTKEAARLAEALEIGTPPDAAEHTQLFAFQLYPYASVYLGAEGMMGGEARDRIAGFWRALGQTPPTEPDHLAVMLGLYAQLIELEASEIDATRRANWHHARKAFLWEHLLSWLPVYLCKLADVAAPFYRQWGAILSQALAEEARALGEPETLSLHLREPMGLFDPRACEAEKFHQSLLTPVRSGMILTRADLSRAARKLGLGLRIGERRFILKALFNQDARATFDWLKQEAQEWSTQHNSQRESFGGVAAVWEEKARAAARLLEELNH